MRTTGSFRPDVEWDSTPWDDLRQLIVERRTTEIQPFLNGLPSGEAGRAVSRLTADEQMALLDLLPPDAAAALLEQLPDVQVTELIEELSADRAAHIVEELSGAEQADVLAELSGDEAEAILRRMAPARATQARRLLAYDPQTAGGIMSVEYLAFRADRTIADVVAELQARGDEYSDYAIQYTYIVDASDRLIGVLRLRDLVLRPGTERLDRIMLHDPLRVPDDTSIEDLNRLFDEHAYIGVPVVDADRRLVGVVRRASVEEAVAKHATRTFLQVAGLVGEEELRAMPIRTRSVRRLSWLSLNIVLNLVSASVIAFYQDTLSAAIALAVFLPIISDMSGCSGNQAVAVSIRELTLGLIRPTEFLRIVVKEGAVGVLNGLVLGILLGIVAYAWKGNVFLSLVVAGALSLNTIVAVLLGGSIPLALRALKLDPALASGPILTTVTDMCGFFFVLSFATVVLSHLA